LPRPKCWALVDCSLLAQTLQKRYGEACTPSRLRLAAHKAGIHKKTATCSWLAYGGYMILHHFSAIRGASSHGPVHAGSAGRTGMLPRTKCLALVKRVTWLRYCRNVRGGVANPSHLMGRVAKNMQPDFTWLTDQLVVVNCGPVVMLMLAAVQSTVTGFPTPAET
jgi:hypothetical protein